MSFARKLLVAMPMLGDPFDRTVILLLDHSAEGGAFGVVLNRPSTTLVTEPLPGWADAAAEPPVVFWGGPVEPQAAIALGRRGGEVATLDLAGDPTGVAELRVFAGYAGWSPGQLEDELTRNAWVVVDSEADDVFRADAEDLWYAVLRRQPPPLDRLAQLPDDLSLN